MSSSFSSASSSSAASFYYAYAFAAVSLFLLVLDPHFEDLGRHFSSILAAFGALGATLGAIGHHLGNLVDPRVKIVELSSTQVRLRLQFELHFGGSFLQECRNFFEKWLPKTIPA